MTNICGRHRDGCPKPHQFSVPVERVGIDALLPDIRGGGTALLDGDTLTVKRADAATGLLRRFTFTHHGAPREYNGGDRVVREGWLVLPG